MTKQQVIDILEAYKPSGNIYNGYNSIEEKVDERIWYLIDEIIESVKREPDDWIKCSDKLPENGEPVIVVVYGSDILMVNDNSIESLKKAIEESREIVRYTTLAYYINGDGWYSDGFPMMVTPEYWMLLPEPPEVK